MNENWPSGERLRPDGAGRQGLYCASGQAAGGLGHRIASVRFTSSKEPLVQDWGWTVGFTVRIRE